MGQFVTSQKRNASDASLGYIKQTVHKILHMQVQSDTHTKRFSKYYEKAASVHFKY